MSDIVAIVSGLGVRANRAKPPTLQENEMGRRCLKHSCHSEVPLGLNGISGAYWAVCKA